MERDKLVINGKEIEPGEHKKVRLHIGKLTTGTKVFINSYIFRSEKAGPTVLLQAGIHGDEINGIEIARRMLSDGLFDNILCGTVIVIPLVNLYGFLQYSREVPDGKDINRKFPGFEDGSLAGRIAYSITEKIVPVIDFGIDFHTAGDHRFNYPHIRYTKDHEASREIALQFASPYILSKDAIEDSLRETCVEEDIPMLVFEGGEALRLNEYSIEVAILGVKRVLAAHDMIHLSPDVHYKVLEMGDTSWLRAPRGGMFQWSKSSGQEVKEGEPLGIIKDPYGLTETSVICDQDGFIVSHNNAPLVYQGDALFNIGYEIDEIDMD